MKLKRLFFSVIVACLVFSLACITSAAASAECTHTYSGACDAECNLCGATRLAAEHYFENSEDYICDECGLSRKECIPGDVNGDGIVNNKDFGILRQYLNKWDVDIDERAADVNADGSVNNKDMGILRQHLNKWDVTLEDPQGGSIDDGNIDGDKGWLEGWY